MTGNPPPPALRRSKSGPLENERSADKAARGRKGGRGKCLACASPRRAEIDRAIVSGDSLRSLEKRFGVSATALRRHKAAHLSPALVAIAQEAGAPEVRGLVDQLLQLVICAQTVLDAAIKGGNGSQALAAIREKRATLELVGRATGELKERPSVAVNLQSSAEWVAARSEIVAIVPPALRPELARRLKALDA